MTRQVGIRSQRQQSQINLKERYQQAHQRYILGQFTYHSHCLIQKLCEKAQSKCKMNQKIIYSILIEISKVMMLNELQLLFLGATLQKMQWKFNDSTLNQYTDTNSPIINLGNINSQTNNPKFQFPLLFIAYTVKKYLNEDMQIYDFKIRDIFKSSFDKTYPSWFSKVQQCFMFSPKTMNEMFKEFDAVNKEMQQIIDYNERVNELFKDSQDRVAKREPPSLTVTNMNTQMGNHLGSQMSYSNIDEGNIRNIIEQQDQQIPIGLPRGFSQKRQIFMAKKDSLGPSLFKEYDNQPPVGLLKNQSQQDQFGAG